MKFMVRITFILIVLSLFSCGSEDDINNPDKRNNNWCWFEDTNTGQSDWVKVGNFNTVENGYYTMFYSKGEIREKGCLENGINVDTTFFFDTQNNLIKYSFKVGDTLRSEFPVNGPYMLQFPDYNIYEEGQVKNKKRIGEWISYYKSGQLERKASFLNGRLSGNYKQWNKAGILIENSNWKNGMLNGKFTSYFDSGQVKAESNWNMKKMNGSHKTWFENGNLNSLSFYNNGKRNGAYELYREDGTKNQNGTFLNGLRHGELFFFDEKGNLFQIDLYNNGELINVKEVN